MATDLLASLKTRLAKMDQTILDKDAKDYLLGLPTNWLADAEHKVVPGIENIMLPLIDQQLKKAEELVAKYGPTIRVIG